MDGRSAEVELIGQGLEIGFGMSPPSLGHDPQPRRQLVQAARRFEPLDGLHLTLRRPHRPAHVGGLGVQEPNTSLGVLISEGAKNIQGATWMLIYPSITLVTILFCLNFIGDGLRDALDPKDR